MNPFDISGERKGAESLELMWQNQDIGAGFLAAGINALWLGMFFIMFLEGFGL